MMERTAKLTQSPSERGTLLGEEILLSALAESPVVGLSAIHEMTAFSKNRIFYGICYSSSSESTKVITVDTDFNLVEGVIITVKFINACAGDQYAKKYINVNQTGAYPIAQSITTYNFLDIAADTIHNFVFANERWVQIDYHRASGTDYGLVMLEDSPNASYDASWGRAATPKALYNLGQQKQNLLVSGTNIKTINNESILGSGNIEIQGGGASSADEVSYENASSGLSAENVQDAIDEVVNDVIGDVDAAILAINALIGGASE